MSGLQLKTSAKILQFLRKKNKIWFLTLIKLPVALGLSEKIIKRYKVFLLDRNSQDKVMKVKFLPEEKIHLIK